MPGSADFGLTLDELRVVARFTAQGAQEVPALYERAVPGDLRPSTAIETACGFADRAARTNLQRLATIGANRAATEAPDEASRRAAGSAGDAAAAAYLHPISRATQVGHILRAVARAAHAAELHDGEQAGVAEAVLERALRRATPVLVDVLSRYPPAAAGQSRVARLMTSLDASLREQEQAHAELSSSP